MADETPKAAVNWTSIIVAVVVMAGLCCCVVLAVAAYRFVGPPVPQPSPAPTVNLANLMPDATHRAKVSAFFGDFAAVIRSDTKPLKTTADFRSAYRLAIPVAKKAHGLPDLQAIDQPVSDLIAGAIGKADQPLDGEPPLRENLATTLQSVSASLSQ